MWWKRNSALRLLVQGDAAPGRLGDRSRDVGGASAEEGHVMEGPLLQAIPVHDRPELPHVASPRQASPRQLHRDLVLAVDQGDPPPLSPPGRDWELVPQEVLRMV